MEDRTEADVRTTREGPSSTVARSGTEGRARHLDPRTGWVPWMRAGASSQPDPARLVPARATTAVRPNSGLLGADPRRQPPGPPAIVRPRYRSGSDVLSPGLSSHVSGPQQVSVRAAQDIFGGLGSRACAARQPGGTTGLAHQPGRGIDAHRTVSAAGGRSCLHRLANRATKPPASPRRRWGRSNARRLPHSHGMAAAGSRRRRTRTPAVQVDSPGARRLR